MAFLNKGLKITLYDFRSDPSQLKSEREKDPKKDEFQYDGGIVDFVKMALLKFQCSGQIPIRQILLLHLPITSTHMRAEPISMDLNRQLQEL